MSQIKDEDVYKYCDRGHSNDTFLEQLSYAAQRISCDIRLIRKFLLESNNIGENRDKKY